MRMLLTGASGFLGRAIATQSLRVGLDVRGISRDPARRPQVPGIELLPCDLCGCERIDDALQGIDTVVHAAAAPPWPDTTAMTRRLLDAMERGRITRLVLISSMAVLDYRSLRDGEEVSEQTPLERWPLDRDGYTQAKIEQERLAGAWAARGVQLSIVRPGAIVAPARVWTPRLGFQLGARRWVQVGDAARLPLVHVDACAEAIVAIVRRSDAPAVIHLINDQPPTQQVYLDAMLARRWLDPPVAKIGYRGVRAVAGAMWPLVRWLPGIRRCVRGLLVPARLDARFKPLNYSNALARRFLAESSPRSALDLLGG